MADGMLDVVIRFVGDTKKLSDDVSKVEGMGSRVGSVGKTMAMGLATGFAGAAIGNFISDATAAEKATNVLASTLKNAGDETGSWAKHAGDLASTLQNQTGVDDEIIKGGQAILGTFHEVSGAAGQQAGVFDRATKAAVDMSAAGFGSVESASTMLGKALQDPTKGITALGRAGVTFTEAQKKQIAAFVETGDLLSAQTMILKEVEGQVGGTAAASVTASDKMKVAAGETSEALGAALLPAMEALAPLLQSVAGFIQDNADVLVPLAGIIAAVTVAQWLWNAAMAANPITLIVIGIAAIIAGIILLIKNWDAVSAAAKKAWDWILSMIQKVWDWIKQNWPLLVAILTGPIGIAVALIIKYWDQIKGAFKAAIDFIWNLWTSYIEFVLGLPKRIFDALMGLAKNLYNVGREMMNRLLDGIKDGVGAVLNKVGDIGKQIVGKLNPFGSPQTVAYYNGQAAVADFVRGIESQRHRAISALSGIGRDSHLSAVGGGGSRTINVNVSGWNGSRVGLGRDVRAAVRAADRWSR